ncbi:MAG: hypothetical protein GYA14_05840 [Ignavibacteria bacterium]|nr:hypothetical protein [Ignavibacteria bacterium]
MTTNLLLNNDSVETIKKEANSESIVAEFISILRHSDKSRDLKQRDYHDVSKFLVHSLKENQITEEQFNEIFKIVLTSFVQRKFKKKLSESRNKFAHKFICQF